MYIYKQKEQKKMGNIEKKVKNKKPSILDPYFDEIYFYHNIGLNGQAISILMNNKLKLNLNVSTYRHFIKKRIHKL